MTAPLLFVGDIHLGRSPHRLDAAGVDSTHLDPAEAWHRVVQYAVQHGVQAVVLAGDVVDQDKDRFEAWSHLSRGVHQLIQQGIRVLGVAGNHDHIALPRLAERIPRFTMLGEGGTWQREELDGVDLIGWSFPSRHHRGDPLAGKGLSSAIEQRRDSALLLGVLHADLDVGESPYAPVRRADLQRLPVDAWFLGHIHQPSDLSGTSPLGYLGSLVGLDRSETGPRGPWLVTPTSGGGLTAEHLALGPVYWTTLDVDLTGIPSGDDAHDRIHAAIEQRITEVTRDDRWLHDGDYSAVGCSVRLSGRTHARSNIHTFIQESHADRRVFDVDDRRWAVVHIADATRPAYDLSTLAAERTPLGQLARLLLALDAAGESAVPAAVQSAMDRVPPLSWSADLERDPLPDRAELIKSAATGLLDQLLDQRSAQGSR